MEEGGSSKQSGMSDSHAMLEDFFDMNELPHALDRMFKDDDMRRQLGVPDEVIDEAKRRGRKLQGIEFESDDGVVCLLAVVFAGFIEFYINEEITGEGGDTTAIAAGVADFVRQLGCDFSGLLTQRCEDWAPQVDVGDLSGFDEVVRGYVGSELSFLSKSHSLFWFLQAVACCHLKRLIPCCFILQMLLLWTVCKLIKEAIAAFSLFIFSPWLLPACYCNYKHEVGCNIESCYDLVASDECCLAGESSDAPTEAPPAKWTAKPDLVDDLTVAYGRYFPYLPFTALLRACNAKPGPGTYFTPRLPNGNIGDIPLFEGFRIRDIFDFSSSSGSGASKKGLMDSLDDEEQFLKDLGQCCNLYDPSEDYSFTDGLNCYELIETTTSDDMSDDCATPCVRMCMEQEKGYTMTEFEFAINAIEASVDGSDFDRVAVVAGAFYLAQGGDPDGIETGVEGIIAELLGEDLLQGLLDLELGGGLFPIRRGGEPLDKCLGFCFMQGSLANLEGFGGGICGAN